MLNAGTDSITIVLYNHADALRVSEMDVTCSVTVSGGLTVQMPENTTMQKNTSSSLSIVVSGFQSGNTYTVTATGVGGYSQTLSATFTVRTQDAGFYQYVDTRNEGYVILNVWTGNVSGTVTFEIPNGLIPDRRNPLLENVTNSVTFQLGENRSQSFKFIIPNNYEGVPTYVVMLNGTIIAVDTVPQN